MRRIHWIFALMILILAATSGCTLSLYNQPLPTPTVLFIPTLTRLVPTAVPPTSTAIGVTPNLPTTIPPTFVPFTSFPLTAVPPTRVPPTQPPPVNFCADGQATALINSFRNALQTSNGELLASLVSPAHGMDARYYRDGRVVNYDQTHAKFLFESTFQVEWGLAPGSGQMTKGSFHEVIIPSLLDLFSKSVQGLIQLTDDLQGRVIENKGSASRGELNLVLEQNRPGNFKVEFARLYTAWGKFHRIFLASSMLSTELWYAYTLRGSLLDSGQRAQVA